MAKKTDKDMTDQELGMMYLLAAHSCRIYIYKWVLSNPSPNNAHLRGSESSKFHDTSLRAQGGGGDDLMRLMCTRAAAPVIEQEAVEQVEQDEQAEQEAADTEVDEDEVEQESAAAAAPPAPAPHVTSPFMQALYDDIFGADGESGESRTVRVGSRESGVGVGRCRGGKQVVDLTLSDAAAPPPHHHPRRLRPRPPPQRSLHPRHEHDEEIVNPIIPNPGNS